MLDVSKRRAVAQRMFPELHPVQVEQMLFAMECVTHRLLKFGWESTINRYDSRRLIILSFMLGAHGASEALLHEGMRKAILENQAAVLDLVKAAA